MGPLTALAVERARPRVGAGRAGWALCLLFLSNAFNIGDRTLLGVVTEPMRLELHLSDTEVSLTNGFMFVLFNLVAGVFIARLVDRGNRVRILAVGIACWSLATAATGMAQGFASLSLARVGVGIGEATGFPAALSLIPDLFRSDVRGRSVAVFQSSTFLGVVGGTILAGVLAAMLGWRSMFAICGLAGVALAVLLFVTVREPAREGPAGTDAAAALPYWSDLLAGCRRVFRGAGFAALAIGFGTSSIIGSVLGAWGPAFLQRSHGVPLAEVGLVIGPAVGLGGISGTLVSGILADRAVRRREEPSDMLKVALWTVPFASPFIMGFVFAPTVASTMLCAAAMNFLLSCAVAPCLNFAITRAEPQDRGLTSTVMLGATGLIGGGFGPFLVGVISDALAPHAGLESLRYGLTVMIAAPLVASLFIAIAWRATRPAP